MPGTGLSTFNAFTQLILKHPLPHPNRFWLQSWFLALMSKQTQVCLGSPSRWVVEPGFEPKQLDWAFNLCSVASLESTLQSGGEPQKWFILQQLSLSVLVFKLAVQLLLAMDRLGRCRGLALDPPISGFAEVGVSVRFGGRGGEDTRIFP